jgi:6-pyruvoyltetrahydropterin/6-carboxytetrahydropterin synthase
VKELEISKDYTFDSAHSLHHLPSTHKCHRMHGHTYGLRIIVRGEMDEAMGWVQDYADISAAVKPLLERIDHHNLNEVLPCITTAENLAIWIYRELKPLLPMLCCVEIKETASSLVTYRP